MTNNDQKKKRTSLAVKRHPVEVYDVMILWLGSVWFVLKYGENPTEIFTALMLAVYSTRHSCYPRAVCATDFQASRLGRVRPINNYILLQQRGGKLKFLLYFCSSQWRAVTNNFNLARLYINPSEPPVAVLVFHVWNGKHLKMSLSLLIVFFSASRIHCSVEWSFLLSLGHRVSSADLHTLAVDGTLVQPCVCVCVSWDGYYPPLPLSTSQRGKL